MPFRRTYYFGCTPGPGKFFHSRTGPIAADSVGGRGDDVRSNAPGMHAVVDASGAASGRDMLAYTMRFMGDNDG
jgi:hypothetical protein